jgi:uncharacterized protein YjbJ (UPF0337 family)
MKKIALASAATGFVAWLVIRNEQNSSRALSWSKRQKLAGTLVLLKGTAKRAKGRIVGDRSLIASGIFDQARGILKRGVGKTVESAKDAIHV